MSAQIGPLTVLPPPGQEQILMDGNGPSPATRELIDSEARRIVDECYEQALQTLREHRDNLERLARRLLEAETLDERQAHAAAGLPEPVAADRTGGALTTPQGPA